ncbi:nucleoside 2-deoxyribosyltransferase [Paraneptunicella aestuarii]|uniref:nucleoside 2-deoxyribosyltransferase n=1 Tax=Paraneptunicella aestuarii TaxID=2831148 RepID=UPI001E3A5293|nr:nucleoside 2-deoxyribosyltransferase [Paraneptunicella aestuarii]UAA38032.1 nucleoside 2-deoxyribosyltransferase [Paraneptunicella aestuarii]
MINERNVDVYFAAPFFCEAERDFNLKLISVLENAGISVFYPPRDGMVAKSELMATPDWEEISNKTWECDTTAIINSKVLLAVTDGRSIDEGVCVEIGFAAAHCVPILAYSSDDRTQFPWGHNPMLVRPISEFISSPSNMISKIHNMLDAAK